MPTLSCIVFVNIIITNEFQEIVCQYNLQNTIHNPTRITSSSQTLLDPKNEEGLYRDNADCLY